MTLIGFIILVVLVLLALGIFVELAGLPGKRARERSHPQADAINVLGWVGLPFGALPWLVALTWAYTNSDPTFVRPMEHAAGAGTEESADG